MSIKSDAWIRKQALEHRMIEPFVESPDGKRVLRGNEPPDEAEVTEWIAAAQQARSLKAA